MELSEKELQQEVGGYIGRMLREHFGKGPESVFVSVGYTFMTVYLRNFITPAERILMEQDQVMDILQIRAKLMKSLMPECKAYMEIITKRKIREVYYDWGLHNKSGMIVFVSDEPFTGKEAISENFTGKAQLNGEITNISKQAQKAPEETYSCELNPRTIVNVRNGILVRIEKELIRLGYSELLKRVKRNLEKQFLHNNNHFHTIFEREVIDSFVDWDFELDKSVIVFIVVPLSQGTTTMK
ncbi:Na-translocating system protein MpsC family protein [Halalkalibacter akibai]|uniref:Na+-translocating membrane potential-generating system MpsC domain-containing protein n=1 Tax=Halalkalibacter akibai (strain ATCC 43226 / DSM 21942 / CIP 109018 / JCM 9157 / 1139) TaxID=1236973 RepID=W4QZF9_HALA3|nr:Na-translocating system protein MpsC family protein [Halalkalibacter akibai]GAE37053.1 hypothetical protein JCM9157_4296 [Halalkalibacter akibai JCM 9157]